MNRCRDCIFRENPGRDDYWYDGYCSKNRSVYENNDTWTIDCMSFHKKENKITENIPEETKKYTHFTWKDRMIFRGKYIKKKNTEKEEMFIESCSEKSGVLYIQFCNISKPASILLEDYEFIDGSPFGKKIKG
jgi:phosphorylcholine metabolism protein LicD